MNGAVPAAGRRASLPAASREKSPAPRWLYAPRVRDQQQQRVHRLIAPLAGEQVQRVLGPVQPQIVGVDDQERRVAEQRPGVDQPPAGLQQPVALVGDDDLQPLFRPVQIGDQLIGEVVDVDHHPSHPGGAQPVEDVVDQRPARHLDQRLGPGVGQRPHSRAEPRRHHHGGFDRRHRQSPDSSNGSPRRSGGTCWSNQAATGASTGCDRSRSR